MEENTPVFDEWERPATLFEDIPIRERTLDVITGLREPTKVATIADQVGCDTETARDYLEWFTEMGIITEHAGHPVRYELNQSYFQWRRIEHIRTTFSDDEIIDQLTTTRNEIQQYETQFDASHPDDVSLLEFSTEIEPTWDILSAWKTALNRLELLDAARRGLVAPGHGDG